MTTTNATRHTHGAAAAQRAAAVRVQADIVRRELDAFEQGLQRQIGAQGSGRALTSGSLENENNELPLSSSQQRTMSSSRDRAGRRGTQLTEKKAADTTTTTMMRSAVLQSLSRTPAFDPHEQHSLLHESLRLQEAARWLLQCPPRTLHVLQQRVLCAAQDHVMTFAGVPSYLKPYVALLNAHAALAQSTGATGKSNESRSTGGMQTWRPPVNGDGERRGEEEEEDDEAAALPVPPPAPLPFFTFLADFILGDEDEASDGSAKKEERAGQGNVAKSRSVLCTGRPQPVATLSSANLIYGLPTIERVLSGAQPSSATPEAGKATSRSSSNNNNNNTTNKTAAQKRKAATATHNSTINTSQDGQGGNAVYVWMEQHQDIMADLVQWGEFFSSFFDEAREGFCREPVSLMCAVLLACGLLAHCELNESLAAQTRRTLRALREADTGPVTHCHTCEACRARQAAIEAAACERVRETTYKKSMTTGAAQLRGATAPSTLSSLSQLLAASSPRLFHGTAAVVLWVETFLVLYRNARGGANTATTTTAGGGGNAGPRQEEHVEDAMRAAEVYLVRDWIAQQAALDALGFEAQAFDGELRLPLSCASDAPLRRLGFTSCGVARAVAAITAWADACVTTGRPLATSVLLGLLREHLPVTAYYMTYFLPLHLPYCE